MTDRGWTVRQVLAWTVELFDQRGVGRTARLDAELLLARVLGKNRLGVYLDLDRPLDETERRLLRGLVVRRANGEPVAYLLGRREFYGLDLAVDPRVLIPRPETELLVDEALARLPPDATGPVVDVGAGSGAIALALAHERPHLQLCAVELEQGAAEVARHNAQALGLQSRVQVVRGDLLGPLAACSLPMVVSNPPYIAPGDPALSPEVARYEPARALYGGRTGLELIRRLLDEAARALVPGGWFLCEIGATQGPAVSALVSLAGLIPEGIRNDLAGLPRVALARRPS
ncbi:MAG: peptide chain release factor N(5)-glutamine methyltransferase [Myxococcota bacterium]|nr:peptide chain release factor N(5)-glutamine methyltransferase [Myxococcota bacterium]